MTWCIEVNVNPQSDLGTIHIDTIEIISEKNRRILAQGKVPTYFIVRNAPTISDARKFADEFLAQNPQMFSR